MGETLKDDEVTEEEAAPEGAKARLFGMLVNEVSLVDRAANKRRFLVTKRDEPMSTKTKTTPAPVAKTEGAGAAAAPPAVAKDGPTQGTAETAADAAGAKPGGGPPGQPAPAQTSDGELPPMQPQTKDALISALASIAEKTVDLVDLLKKATTDEKAPGTVPEPVTAQLKALGDMFTSVMGQYAGGGATTDKAGDLAGVTENGGVTAQGAQKAADGDDEMEKAIKSLVAKAGKKMAKERLTRFAQALNMLAQIHRELKVAKAAAGAPAPARASLPAGAATELTAIVEALEGLTTAHETLRKAHDTLAAENVELRKRGGVRNSEAGDGLRPPAPTREVHWPLDMNNPRTAKSSATNFADSAPKGR